MNIAHVRIARAALSAMLCLALVAAFLPSRAFADDFRRGWVRILDYRERTLAELPVEIADTLELRLIGLSGRAGIGASRGMFFDFEEDQVMNMWMRDVHMPLDMIFMRRDGSVIRVARNATPGSSRIHSSEEEGRYVLCIPAGLADKIGIKRGVRVIASSHRGGR